MVKGTRVRKGTKVRIATALAVAIAGWCMWCGAGIESRRHLARHILEKRSKHPAYAISWAKTVLRMK